MLNENAIMVNIKRGRESLGLEPSEMADRLGVELRVYKMYESGVKTPGTKMLFRIADAFGKTVDELNRD